MKTNKSAPKRQAALTIDPSRIRDQPPKMPGIVPATLYHQKCWLLSYDGDTKQPFSRGTDGKATTKAWQDLNHLMTHKEARAFATKRHRLYFKYKDADGKQIADTSQPKYRTASGKWEHPRSEPAQSYATGFGILPMSITHEKQRRFVSVFDLDNAIYLDKGKPILRAWAQPPVDAALEAKTWISYSTSGRGLHIVFLSDDSTECPHRRIVIDPFHYANEPAPTKAPGIDVYGLNEPEDAPSRRPNYVKLTSILYPGSGEDLTFAPELVEVLDETALSFEKAKEPEARTSTKVKRQPGDLKGPWRVVVNGLATEYRHDVIPAIFSSTFTQDDDVMVPAEALGINSSNQLKVSAKGVTNFVERNHNGTRKVGNTILNCISRDYPDVLNEPFDGFKDDPQGAALAILDVIEEDHGKIDGFDRLRERIKADDVTEHFGDVSHLVDEANNDNDNGGDGDDGGSKADFKPFRDIFDSKLELDPIPFPEDVLNANLKKYATQVGNTIGIDPDASAFAFLMGTCAMIPGSVRLKINDQFTNGANVYGLLVGSSGSGKSPLMAAAILPLTIADKAAIERYKADKERWERDTNRGTPKRKRGRPPKKPVGEAPEAKDGTPAAPPQEPAALPDMDNDGATVAPMTLLGDKPLLTSRTVTNTTTEKLVDRLASTPAGVVYNVDEMTAFTGRLGKYTKAGGGDDMAMFLTAYEGSAVTYERASRDPIVASSVHLSILTGLQTKLFRESISPLTGNGLFQRFQFCLLREQRKLDATPDEDLRERFLLAGKLLLALDLDEPLTLTDEAEAARAKYVLGDFDLRQRATSEFVKSCIGKAPGLIARITVGLHCADWAWRQAGRLLAGKIRKAGPLPDEIDADTIKRATAYVDGYYLGYARLVGNIGESSDIDDARELATKVFLRVDDAELENLTWTTIREKAATFRGSENTPRLETALSILTRFGWVKPKGRNCKVNPEALRLLKERSGG